MAAAITTKSDHSLCRRAGCALGGFGGRLSSREQASARARSSGVSGGAAPLARTQRRASAQNPASTSSAGPSQSRSRGRLERRAVEHEIAVALHHEVDDLVVAPARGDLLADLAAQVHRELGVRIGDRLVLAHEAAQLLGEPHRALAATGSCSVGTASPAGASEARAAREQRAQERSASSTSAASATSGRIFSSSASA